MGFLSAVFRLEFTLFITSLHSIALFPLGGGGRVLIPRLFRADFLCFVSDMIHSLDSKVGPFFGPVGDESWSRKQLLVAGNRLTLDFTAMAKMDRKDPRRFSFARCLFLFVFFLFLSLSLSPLFFLCCAVLCSAALCSAVLCSAVQCSVVQCCPVRCCAVQCSVVLCSAVQCSAVLALTYMHTHPLYFCFVFVAASFFLRLCVCCLL